MTVLTVSFSDKRETQEFVAQGNYTMPMLLDTQEQVKDAYRVFGVPTLVIIDRQGIIRYVHMGIEEMAVQEVEALLAEAGR